MWPTESFRFNISYTTAGYTALLPYTDGNTLLPLSVHPYCHRYLYKATHAKTCFLLLFLLFLSNTMLPAAQPTSSKVGQVTLQTSATSKSSRSLLSIGSWSVRRELSWLADISASNCPAIKWKLPESMYFILLVSQGGDKCSCMQYHFHITIWEYVAFKKAKVGHYKVQKGCIVMCALSMAQSVTLTEQTGFDVASDYGEDMFHSSQYHRRKTDPAVRPGLHVNLSTVGSWMP